jgi:hypothetical protein
MTKPAASRAVWGVALPVYAALLTFANTLPNAFAYDDIAALQTLERLVREHSWFAGVHRSLTHATFLLDWTLWGTEPLGYHTTNLVLHAIATGLVAHVSLRLTGRRSVGLACGLLFAVHPVHVEAVASFYNRKDILALIFSLLSFNFWLVSHNRKRAYFAALLCFGLALLSKEVAVVGLVPVFLLADLLFASVTRSRVVAIQKSCLRLAPLFLAAVGAAAWALHGSGGLFSQERIQTLSEWPISSYPTVLANVFSSFPDNLRLLFLPATLSPDYPTRPNASLSDPHTLLGLFLLVAWIAAAVYFLRRIAIVGFAMAWTVIMYLPVSNVVPLTHYFVAERYLYVPSVGVCLLLGTVLGRFHASTGARRRTSRVAFLVALLCLVTTGAARSVARNRDWHDQESLWSAAARDGHHTFRIHYQLAKIRMAEGRHAEAMAEFQRALLLVPPRVRSSMCDNILTQAPDDPFCNCVAAENAWRAGRTGVAVSHYERVVKSHPYDVEALTRLAWLLAVSKEEALRDPERAMGLAKRAIERQKNPSAESLFALAAAHAELGNFAGALTLADDAHRIATAGGDQGLASRIQLGLECFRRGMPLSRAKGGTPESGEYRARSE